MAPRWGYQGRIQPYHLDPCQWSLGFRFLSVRLGSEERLARVESLGCRELEHMTTRSAAGLAGVVPIAFMQCRCRKDASWLAAGTEGESITHVHCVPKKLNGMHLLGLYGLVWQGHKVNHVVSEQSCHVQLNCKAKQC